VYKLNMVSSIFSLTRIDAA